MRLARLAAFALVMLSSVACGGGGGSSIPSAGGGAGPTPTPQSSAAQTMGSATFSFFIPTASAMKRARPNYISPNTQFAGITLTEQAGAPVPSPTPLVVNFAPGSPNCSASSGGTTCTITATYLVGADAWTIGLYGSGGVSSTPLSINNVSQTLVAGQNTIHITMNPVVAGLGFSPNSGTCASSNTTCVQPAVLEALDATNAVIIGPGSYVNASQAAVTVNLSQPPSSVTLETSSGAAAATSANGPAQLNLAQIGYNGAGAAGPLTINASDTNGDRTSYTLNVTSLYPPDTPSKIPSTYGRIGLAQIFDYLPGLGTQMPTAQITADAHLYDMVWASFNPQPWRTANPQALISRYYIIEEDNVLISGNNLQWWKQNHADWILYACNTSTGNPTSDYAYAGSGFADVPLNIHNPSVVQYQVQNLLSYVQANDYNAFALDQVLLNDFMIGGSPPLGQTENENEYACGTYNADGTFNKVYSSPNDPTWTQDVLNWVSAAKTAASKAGVAVFINHPALSTTNPNEQQLISMVDGTIVEAGFSVYGLYPKQGAGYFANTYKYMEWVEQQGKAFIDINRFTANPSPDQYIVTSDELEYAIGTYMMGNEGNADLYTNANNKAGSGYGAEQYHSEYATASALGQPCSAMTEDTQNPQIYYRRFQNGMVVVNAGGAGTQNATLPTIPNHTYTDLEGTSANHGSVTNPLPVSAYDAWVLTLNPGDGTGCS